MKSRIDKSSPAVKMVAPVKTLWDLMMFYYRTIFLRNWCIWNDHRSYPVADFFGDGPAWWGSMAIYFKYLTRRDNSNTLDEKYFKGINIEQQVENIEKFTAIVRSPWRGQTDIVIGCGHRWVHCHGKHREQYTVDSDMKMGADCAIEVGNFSLARVIPQAKGKIKRIILEGLLIQENPCFQQDVLDLLEEGGCVLDSFDTPVITKMNGELFALHTMCPRCNEVHNCIEPYVPWTLQVDGSRVRVLDLGSNALGWYQQYHKVMFERAEDKWVKDVKIPKTPFDRDFLIL
jgi:hypothetical protein